METTTPYQVPTALTILAGIFLALGAICLIIPIVDMVWRKGWRSMMWIMIPVWPINAAYLGPLSLFLYFRYGRPTHPSQGTTCHPSGKPDTSPEKENNSMPPPVDSQASSATEAQDPNETHDQHAMGGSRPIWATVAIEVSHCGAGCVLRDLVGEWLVYGTSTTINNRAIWPELLIDYAFAILFGIEFQYFSIAPMSGD